MLQYLNECNTACAVHGFLQMELSKKFQMATSCHIFKVDSLEVYRKYPIMKAERVTTRFGQTVLPCIQDSTFNLIKVFIPQRYVETFYDSDLDAINTKTVSLHLVYKGKCDKTKTNILAIVYLTPPLHIILLAIQ